MRDPNPITVAGLFGCLTLSVFPVGAPAATYLVRPDGTGDFPTIQGAIKAVQSGDTIELADGTFTGPGNRGLDYRGKAITVRSRSGDPASCKIYVDDASAGVVFQSGEGPGSVLASITIYGAWAAPGGNVSEPGAAAHREHGVPVQPPRRRLLQRFSHPQWKPVRRKRSD